ncbi:MAG TPA: helix-turn-helix domain-containing protein [Solirubrobacterales bacterium]
MPGVQEAVRFISATLEDRIDDLVETMFDRMRREVAEFRVDAEPELAEALRESCYGNLQALLAELAADRRVPGAIPSAAAREAVVTARSGVSLAALTQTYRIGQAVLWEAFLDVVEEMRLPASRAAAVLRIGSQFCFAYIDAVVPLVAEEYERERGRRIRTSAQRRMQLVRDLLGGAAVESSELGYDLGSRHIGVVVAGGDEAVALIQDLAPGLGCTALTLAVSEDTAWGWIANGSGDREVTASDVAAAWPERNFGLALGEPASGIEGFRETHRQALTAHQLAARLERGVVRYDEVVVEALALADEPSSRRFAERELGELAGADEKQGRLRETLDVYLTCAMNASAAGAVLGVTDRTVGYRLRAIEDSLGHSIALRSTELALALRIRRLFAAPRLRDSKPADPAPSELA